MRRYPVGLQDFSEVRTGGYLYVDKTYFVEQITSQSKYYFLSRPRRFGKSLFLSTLHYLYLGRKELFEGLYIYDKWDWNKKLPVIKISFASIGHKDKGLRNAINDQLDEIAAQFDITFTATTIDQKFRELIQLLHAKLGKVVVLIDEYDKPIIDYLGTETAKAVENRDVFKSFYSILKDADPHLELVFITGVSKFARVSIFSDLNNLRDITLISDFDGICGITEEELKLNFAEELNSTNAEEIKRWYNGYNFGKTNTVYNPFSLLSFFINNLVFKNYWFETGTPTFLIKLARKSQLYDFEGVRVSSNVLSAYDIERLQIIPLMFQTGYLTIKSQEIDEVPIYTLGYPNLEVKSSYLDMLLTAYTDDDMLIGSIWANDLKKALHTGQIEKLQGLFNALFKSIPYELWQKENEHFYHALIHLTFRLLGIYVESQVHSADGRLDALVQTTDYVYCFEFKLDGDADVALQQIKDKGYLMPYLQGDKNCIGIGLNFSKELKKVEKIVWEKLII